MIQLHAKRIFRGIRGSLVSPSSACHQQPQSLGLILKAALAEQDFDCGSGRELQGSQEFSTFNSVKGDETEIVIAEQGIKEESRLY